MGFPIKDSESKSDSPQSQESDSNIKIRIAICCLCSYFIVGWIAYCFLFESFTFTEATYFLMVTLTTVGYGDLTPTSQSSRLFTMFFILFGIAIVAVALVEIADYIMKQRRALLKKTQAEVIKKASEDKDITKEPEIEKKASLLDRIHVQYIQLFLFFSSLRVCLHLIIIFFFFFFVC